MTFKLALLIHVVIILLSFLILWMFFPRSCRYVISLWKNKPITMSLATAFSCATLSMILSLSPAFYVLFVILFQLPYNFLDTYLTEKALEAQDYPSIRRKAIKVTVG